jgi:hypothetical protein
MRSSERLRTLLWGTVVVLAFSACSSGSKSAPDLGDQVDKALDPAHHFVDRPAAPKPPGVADEQDKGPAP